MSDEPQTSFLRARAKKAKQAAAASSSSLSAKRTNTPNSLREPTSTNQRLTELAHVAQKPQIPDTAAILPEYPDTEDKPQASAPDTQTTRPNIDRNARPNIIMLKTDDDRAPAATALASRSDADEQILALFRTHAPNKAALDLFELDLPAIIRTLIRGACIVGIRGHQDRMTVFRMMGVPWTPTNGGGARGAVSGENMDAMADRIARAVTRREGRLLGHDPVTIDVPIEPEAAPVLAEAE